MKVSISPKKELLIISENTTEEYALNKWIDENRINSDRIKIVFKLGVNELSPTWFFEPRYIDS